jgi:hypothetical protein
MAYISRLPSYSRGGIVHETLREGVPVVFSTSGERGELPVFHKAPANSVSHVGVLIVPPDDFQRPTPEGMYTAKPWVVRKDVFTEPVDTTTMYRVGKSTLWNPTVTSGELAAFMRGVTVAVPSECYVDSDAIKVPGARIKVGSTNLWEVTTTESEAVGVVEEYNTTNNMLLITIWE